MLLYETYSLYYSLFTLAALQTGKFISLWNWLVKNVYSTEPNSESQFDHIPRTIKKVKLTFKQNTIKFHASENPSLVNWNWLNKNIMTESLWWGYSLISEFIMAAQHRQCAPADYSLSPHSPQTADGATRGRSAVASLCCLKQCSLVDCLCVADKRGNEVDAEVNDHQHRLCET